MKATLKPTCAVILAAIMVVCAAIANADTPTAPIATVPMAATLVPAPEKVAMCRGCHGIAQYRTAYPLVYSVPKLGGQQAAYIVKALKDYRQGLRNHATMQSIAATLTDDEVAAIAAYYAAAKPASGSSHP